MGPLRHPSDRQTTIGDAASPGPDPDAKSELYVVCPPGRLFSSSRFHWWEQSRTCQEIDAGYDRALHRSS